MTPQNTICYRNFIQNHNVIYNLLVFFLDYSKRLHREKEYHLQFKSMAEKLGKDGKALQKYKGRIKQEEKEVKAIRDLIERNMKLEPQFLEIIFATYINYYLTYLTDLMLKIYQKPLDQFFLNRKIKGSDVIGKKFEEFIKNETRKGFTEIEKNFSGNFEIKLSRNTADLKKIQFSVHIRNVLVHRNGITDEKFIGKWRNFIVIELKNKHFCAGAKISLNNDYIFSVFPLLDNSVKYIDNEAMKKFAIR